MSGEAKLTLRERAALAWQQTSVATVAEQSTSI